MSSTDSQDEAVYRPPRGSAGDTSPDISDLIAANQIDAVREEDEANTGHELIVRRRDHLVLAASVAVAALFLVLGWVLWRELDPGYADRAGRAPARSDAAGEPVSP